MASFATPLGRAAMVALARRWAMRLLGAALVLWAVVVLWRELHSLAPAEVVANVRAWGVWRIALVICLAAASFTLTAIVEWMGLRWSGTPLPFPTAALRSFMVNGLIHSVGANVVTATIVRSWVYRRTDLRLLGSAATTAFAAMSLVLGLAVLVGAGLLTATPGQLHAVRLSIAPARAGAAITLGGVVAYVAACAAWPGALLFRKLRMPNARVAIGQAALGAVDNAISATMLWLLIGRGAAPYPAFIVAYPLAYLAGLLSTVPGGAGVFEAALVLLLPGVSRPALAAGFLGYRLIFYLAPLALALLLIAVEMARPFRPIDLGQGGQGPGAHPGSKGYPP